MTKAASATIGRKLSRSALTAFTSRHNSVRSSLPELQELHLHRARTTARSPDPHSPLCGRHLLLLRPCELQYRESSLASLHPFQLHVPPPTFLREEGPRPAPRSRRGSVAHRVAPHVDLQ